MIPILDISLIEQALADYLEAYFAAGEITVPQADTGETEQFSEIAPPIVRGLSSAIEPARSPVVVIVCNQGPAEMPGVYGGEDFEVNVIVVTPVLIEGIEDAHHAALCAAVVDAFPNRAGNGAVDEDFDEVHETIGDIIAGLTDYRLQGYYAEAGPVAKSKDRLEQALRWMPGLMHQSLVPGP